MPNLFRERFKEPWRGCGAAGGCEGAFIAAGAPGPAPRRTQIPAMGRFAAKWDRAGSSSLCASLAAAPVPG